MKDSIKEQLHQASQHLSNLRLDACLDQIEQILAEANDHQKPYYIGIRAAQISDDKTKLLSLIDRGLQNIQGDRRLFLEKSYKTCKQMGLVQQCLVLAEQLTTLGRSSNRVDLLLYQADAFLLNNDAQSAEQMIASLIKQYPNNLDCRLKALECKRHNQDWDGARRLARQMTRRFPTAWIGYDLFAEECLRAGKIKKIVKVYQAAVAANDNPAQSSNTPTTSLTALQYYSPNKNQNHSVQSQERIKLVNEKIQLQWNASLRDNDNYQLVDAEHACAIIDQTVGHQEVDLFRKCALPAMQADVIRVVHLATQAHALYIDWPYRPFQLSPLLSQTLFQTGQSMLAGKCRNQDWILWNGFAYSSPHNSLQQFFTTVMERIFYNIEHEICNNVYLVTGPAVWQKAYQNRSSDQHRETIQQITYPGDIYQVFQPALNKRPSMQGHWSKVQDEQSIFTDHAKRAAAVQQDQ